MGKKSVKLRMNADKLNEMWKSQTRAVQNMMFQDDSETELDTETNTIDLSDVDGESLESILLRCFASNTMDREGGNVYRFRVNGAVLFTLRADGRLLFGRKETKWLDFLLALGDRALANGPLDHGFGRKYAQMAHTPFARHSKIADLGEGETQAFVKLQYELARASDEPADLVRLNKGEVRSAVAVAVERDDPAVYSDLVKMFTERTRDARIAAFLRVRGAIVQKAADKERPHSRYRVLAAVCFFALLMTAFLTGRYS